MAQPQRNPSRDQIESSSVETPLMAKNLKLRYSDDHESLSIRAASNPIPLYDPDSTLDISKDLADGYLILLSGGHNSSRIIQQARNKKDAKNISKNKAKSDNNKKSVNDEGKSPAESILHPSALRLSFAALTDGNVLEIAFGVKSDGGLRKNKLTSQRAFDASRTARAALLDASIASDNIVEIAVRTYCKLFEIVLQYHMDLQQLGIITWCVKHQKIRDQALRSLDDAFSHLSEAITASI